MKSKILLFLALSLLIAAGAHASVDSQPRIVLVSDVDDTIRLTRIHPLGHYLDFFVGLFKQRAFVGMPALYNFLQTKNVQFEYVSGTPKLFSFFPNKFLQIAGFPAGNLDDRTDTKISIEDYKYQEISALMRASPTSQFILIGDNGQRDVAAYRRLQNNPELSHLIKAVYIHKIYSGEVAMQLAPGQIPFYTAADLAVQLSEKNLVTQSELNSVLRLVDQGIESDFREVQQRTQPDIMQLNSWDLRQLKTLGQNIPMTDNSSIFQSILQKIRPTNAIFCSEIL